MTFRIFYSWFGLSTFHVSIFSDWLAFSSSSDKVSTWKVESPYQSWILSMATSWTEKYHSWASLQETYKRLALIWNVSWIFFSRYNIWYVCYNFQSKVGKLKSQLILIYCGKNMSIFEYREVEKFIISWAQLICPSRKKQLCHKWFRTTIFPLM